MNLKLVTLTILRRMMRVLLIQVIALGGVFFNGGLLAQENYAFNKSPSNMAKGMTGTAYGTKTSDMFFNPANLGNLSDADGWQFDIINFYGSFSDSDNMSEQLKDIRSVETAQTEIQKVEKVNSLLNKYDGNSFGLAIGSSLLAVGKNFKDVNFLESGSNNVAIGLAPIGGLIFNMKITSPTSLTDNTTKILDINLYQFRGLAYGVAVKFDKLDFGSLPVSDVSFGVSFKTINYEAIGVDMTASEVYEAANDIVQDLRNKVIKGSSLITADIGLTAEVYENLRLGLSVMNMGGIGDKNVAVVPASTNIGVTYHNDLLKEGVFLTEYSINIDSINYSDCPTCGSKTSTINLGATLDLVSSKFFDLSISAGSYFSKPTFGVDLYALGVKFSYASFTEQIGDKVGEVEDKRTLVGISIGF